MRISSPPLPAPSSFAPAAARQAVIQTASHASTPTDKPVAPMQGLGGELPLRRAAGSVLDIRV